MSAHPLPWTNEPDLGSSKGIIRDANGELILIYGRNGEELRARIVTAVNSYNALLAVALRVALVMKDRSHAGNIFQICFEDLQAVLAKTDKIDTGIKAPNADLLAAAKAVLFSRELLADEARLYIALEAAVASAEKAP